MDNDDLDEDIHHQHRNEDDSESWIRKISQGHIPKVVDWDAIDMFIRYADEFDCVEQVKNGVRVALESMSRDTYRWRPEKLLVVAHDSKHAECFAKINDRIAKYEDDDASESLRANTSGANHKLHGVHRLLKANQARLKKALLTKIGSLVNTLSCYYHDDNNHTEEQHTRLDNGEESDIHKMTPNVCNRHHLAVMKCHAELVSKEVWLAEGDGITLDRLVTNINYLSELQGINECSSECNVARLVMRDFAGQVQQLKTLVRTTFAGVCYHCFVAKKDMKSCGHEPSVSKFMNCI